MTTEKATLIDRLDRFRRRVLLTAGAGSLLCLVGGVADPEQFFHSYLQAFLFWFGITIGSVAILMLHHLIGGLWGFMIQRFLETAARLLPLTALLAIPLLPGIPFLYEWSHTETLDATLLHKSPYLNTPFFIIRMAAYFATWITVAHLLTRWSAKVDETGEVRFVNRMEQLSGPGLVVYALTMSFAAIDWVMSLEPHWYSTIFGIIFLVGQGVSTIAFVIIVATRFADQEPLSRVVSTKRFHDLGNLLLAFVMLWAYVAFSQFLIIWSGNITEEVTWYKHRLEGGWNVVAFILIILHFAVPFLLLLQRNFKKRAGALSAIAFGLLFLRLVDLFWIVSPALHPTGFHLHWLDVLAPVTVGGLWLGAFASKLKRIRLLPVRDPRLLEATEQKEVMA